MSCRGPPTQRNRPAPAWPGFRPLHVTKIVPESETVSSIYLAAADGTPLPVAKPGQYLTVRVSSAGQPAPVRSYSLSSAPGSGIYRISVKHEPNGLVSGYLITELAARTNLEVAAPRGDFVLDEDQDSPVLLLSAGIGVTPVLAMLHESSPRTASARSGGFMVHAGRASTRWPQRHITWSRRCRMLASTCSIARPLRRSCHTNPAAAH